MIKYPAPVSVRWGGGELSWGSYEQYVSLTLLVRRETMYSPCPKLEVV